MMNEALNQALQAMRTAALEFTTLIPRLGEPFKTNAALSRDALNEASKKLEALRPAESSADLRAATLDLREMRNAALDLLDWIERTGGALFRDEAVLKRGRVDVDQSSANAEHNEQVRNAIARLREECGTEPQPERCDVWKSSERGQLCTREKGHLGPHHFV